VVICLEQGADLHAAQLMPLPFTVSCFSKIQIGFTFLVYWLTWVVSEKGPLNGCLSPAGRLPRTGISSGTLRSVTEYRLPLPFFVHSLRVSGVTAGLAVSNGSLPSGL